MSKLRNLIILFSLTILVPWVVLLVMPLLQNKAIKPMLLENDAYGVSAKYYPAHEVFAAGAEIYQSEGCAYCHTQVIRDPRAGDDIYKLGWGKVQSGAVDKAEETPLARVSLPHDYVGEKYAPIGIERTGPDLSNVGYRRSDPAWHHMHLYNPKSVTTWSTMPSMKHLYRLREIKGQPSQNALPFTGRHKVKEGYEVVPTKKAEILVKYLLSLKRGSDAPKELLNQPIIVKQEAEKN